ncbi:MAG: RagB/SusD family nutrient uptake outer membrane protein [Bacteroides sp.]|nr:RagB/SusD family nutrient uptake outer membrane protein [Bacteroides sp.]
MKISKFTYIVMGMMVGCSLTACEDFLNRPNEDSYNDGNYFQNDAQTKVSVNTLYNSPWYDFLSRGYYKIPEVLSGNLYMGGSPYANLTVNGSDDDIKSTSSSLWAVNAQANTIYNRLKTANASESVRNTAMGECLAWKAMAYFYLVRIFGEVPIVHDNSSDIAAGNYNEKYKVKAADIYEYIVMTLEKAIELLPENNQAGRIDRWAAKGLLAKVYLAKSGINANGNGQRDASDLAKAAEYAKDVINNSGKKLMENYEDIFKGENDFADESLFGWRWTAEQNNYTCGNCLTSELAMSGFEIYQSWGDWTAPSVDLQDAFSISPLDNPTAGRNVSDSRRKATMMMAGDKYDYWWQDKGGFDYLKFLYDKEYAPGSNDGLQSTTGANIAKHLYGNANDHIKTFGISPNKQCSSLSTHVLRLADVYLIYAEAVIGNSESTTDASAIDAYYAVHHRAVSGSERPASITLDEVLKERRLELAFEGDYWFDLVRMSYYDVDKAMNILKGQRRNGYYGLSDLYKEYYTNQVWNVDASTMYYETNTPKPNVTASVFKLPFPDEDVVYNPHLLEEAQHVDVRTEFAY